MSSNTILSDSQIKSLVIDYLFENVDRYRPEFVQLLEARKQHLKDTDVVFHSDIEREFNRAIYSMLEKDIVSDLNLDLVGVIMALEDINLRQFLKYLGV